MTDRVHYHSNLILSVGTQVVTLIDVMRQNGNVLRAGEVQAHLPTLNEEFKLPFIPDLVERKVNGKEKGCLDQADVGFHQREFERLRAELEQAYQASRLPEAPNGAAALHDLLLRIRLGKN